MYLHYAAVIGDFEKVIEHWILEEDWAKAIEVIDRQVCNQKLFVWTRLMLISLDGASIVLPFRPSTDAERAEGDR